MVVVSNLYDPTWRHQPYQIIVQTGPDLEGLASNTIYHLDLSGSASEQPRIILRGKEPAPC
jgi:hypothetical protein